MVTAGIDVLYVQTGTRAPVTSLSTEESALVENYMASSPEHGSTLKTVSAALGATRSREESWREVILCSISYLLLSW